MSKLDILKIDGTTSGSMDIPTALTIEPKKELIHQAVVMYMANSRLSNAHTKTRAEVSGGGRKPWKQKGTGRARAGSSRSPLWIGGGITFGPRDENFSKRMPVKMRRMALAMALSSKITENKVSVLEDLTISEAKTREIVKIVASIAPTAKSVLLVTAAIDPVAAVATRNLTNVAIINASDLNTYDILNFDHLIFTKDAVDVVSKQVATEAKAATPKAESK